MKNIFRPQLNLYIMQPLVKGFSVFYFVLLPIFYSEKLLDSIKMGYIGGIFIVMVILGAVVVAQWLHSLTTQRLLQVSSVVALGASLVLFTGVVSKNILLLFFAYTCMGLAVGTAMSGVNAFAASVTTQGNRYASLANISMLTDLVRIIFPAFVSVAILFGTSLSAIVLIICTACIFLLFSFFVPHINHGQEIILSTNIDLKKNTNFLYALSLEFFDSFSSSQLFVFLPLVFLAKGYSLENSLILQSFIFLGYLCGRWFVSTLAKKYSGVRAISFAEFGMVCSIILLLVLRNLSLLYLCSFLLGIFARGTSPAIKALAFDSLTKEQMKKGSALHVVAGDSGSAIGQLLFGFFVAWFGVNSPFVASAGIALILGLVTLVKPIQIQKIDS